MRTYLMVALAGAIVLGWAGQARGVLFTFDDPAELDQWEVVIDWRRSVWAVEDGVLRITADAGGQPTAVRVVRDLELLEGSISFRVRVVDLDPKPPDWRRIQVGAVFRVQPDPSPDGYPGQYVYLIAPDHLVRWESRRYCAWVQGTLCGGGGGWGAYLENWRADTWTRMVITFDRGGWHEVYVDLGGGLERVVGANDVLGKRVATRVPADLRKPPALAELQMRPVSEIIKTADPMFGVGRIGIYVEMNRPGDLLQVEIDDFDVRTWLAVPEGLVTTTWGALR